MAAPSLRDLAEKIYVELTGKFPLAGVAPDQLKTNAQNMAKLSFSLASVFLQVEDDRQLADSQPKAKYEVQLTDIGG